MVPFVIGFSVAGAEPAAGEEVCRFQDPQIVESSGLVARDGLFVTVNDSGDSGRVFVVDAQTCRTVGGTTWSDEVEDVEAVAPRTATGYWSATSATTTPPATRCGCCRCRPGGGSRR